jgi:hypothetical protein
MKSRTSSGAKLSVRERAAAWVLHPSHHGSRMRERALEEMVNDPAIRHELRKIEADFSGTEFDGLETCS